MKKIIEDRKLGLYKGLKSTRRYNINIKYIYWVNIKYNDFFLFPKVHFKDDCLKQK